MFQRNVVAAGILCMHARTTNSPHRTGIDELSAMREFPNKLEAPNMRQVSSRTRRSIKESG